MRWVSAAAAAGLGRWGLPVKNGEAGRLLLPECPGLLVGPDRNGVAVCRVLGPAGAAVGRALAGSAERVSSKDKAKTCILTR